jgi:hypothetical protein
MSVWVWLAHSVGRYLSRVFNEIRDTEIVMPSEQQGAMKEDYEWKVMLLRVSCCTFRSAVFRFVQLLPLTCICGTCLVAAGNCGFLLDGATPAWWSVRCGLRNERWRD